MEIDAMDSPLMMDNKHRFCTPNWRRIVINFIPAEFPGIQSCSPSHPIDPVLLLVEQLRVSGIVN